MKQQSRFCKEWEELNNHTNQQFLNTPLPFTSAVSNSFKSPFQICKLNDLGSAKRHTELYSTLNSASLPKL